MMGAVKEYLEPLGVKTANNDSKLAGGYFVWIELPRSLKAEDITKRALEEKDVLVGKGQLFQVQGDQTQDAETFERNIRLSFAWEEEEKLPEGIRKLALVIARSLKST